MPIKCDAQILINRLISTTNNSSNRKDPQFNLTNNANDFLRYISKCISFRLQHS